MAPQLWMLRHGEAVPHDSKPDDERELTPRGERQSEAAGRRWRALNEEFDACYSSPKVRALGDRASWPARASTSSRSARTRWPTASAASTRSRCWTPTRTRRSSSSATSPSFSQVVYDFTGARVDFKKGGVAAINARRGAGELLVLAAPARARSASAQAAKGRP